MTSRNTLGTKHSVTWGCRHVGHVGVSRIVTELSYLHIICFIPKFQVFHTYPKSVERDLQLTRGPTPAW